MRTVSIEAYGGSRTVDIGDISVDVEPEDVLDELSSDEIKGYLIGRFGNDVSIDSMFDEAADLAHQYWHGDFDLKKFIEAVGKDEIRKFL